MFREQNDLFLIRLALYHLPGGSLANLECTRGDEAAFLPS